MQRRYAP